METYPHGLASTVPYVCPRTNRTVAFFAIWVFRLSDLHFPSSVPTSLPAMGVWRRSNRSLFHSVSISEVYSKDHDLLWIESSLDMELRIFHSYHGSTSIQRYGNGTQMRFNRSLGYIGSYGVSCSTSQVKKEFTEIWLLAAPLETIGLFGFAWTSLGPPHVHWIAPMIFSTCIAIANVGYLMHPKTWRELTKFSSMQYTWLQLITWLPHMDRIPLRLLVEMHWLETSLQVLLQCIQLPVSNNDTSLSRQKGKSNQL